MNEDGAKALSAEPKKLLRSATTATIAGVLYRKGIRRSSIAGIWSVAADTTNFIGTAGTRRHESIQFRISIPITTTGHIRQHQRR